VVLDNFCMEWFARFATTQMFFEWLMYSIADRTDASYPTLLDLQLFEGNPEPGLTMDWIFHLTSQDPGVPSGDTANLYISGPNVVGGGGMQASWDTLPVTGGVYAWSIDSTTPAGRTAPHISNPDASDTVNVDCFSSTPNGDTSGADSITGFVLRLIITVGGVTVQDTSADIAVTSSVEDLVTLNDAAFDCTIPHHIAFIRDGGSLYICLDGVAIASGPRTTGPLVISGMDTEYDVYVDFGGAFPNSFKMRLNRLSNVARYSPPFTPPAPGTIVVDAQTVALWKYQDGNPDQATDETGVYDLPVDDPTVPLTYGPF
jgi:hypothetical protein